MKKKYASPVLLLEELDELQDVGLGVDDDPEENVPASAAGTGHDE